MAAFAVTAPGLAPLAAAELAGLGLAPAAPEPGGVPFAATPEALLRANLWSRLASRVLVRLAEFGAHDFATLERRAAGVPWRAVVPAGATVRLRVTCRKSRLYHSDAVAERVARGLLAAVPGAVLAAGTAAGADADDEATHGDAAAAGGDRHHGAPEALIVVRLDHDRCVVSADSSGALLHRRGWRLATAKAPLRETLAAALVAASGWDGTTPLVDPFGGSGTIGIEAALRARGLAPGRGRRFACERWPAFADTDGEALATRLRREAAAGARARAPAPIVVADRDAGACEAARANAARAGVGDDLTVVQRPLAATDLASLGPAGWVVTNPPYGMRVAEGRDLRALYATLGRVLRDGGAGWRLAMVSADDRLAGQVRLPLVSRLRTVNGGLPVRFLVMPGGPEAPAGADPAGSGTGASGVATPGSGRVATGAPAA